MRLYGRGSAGPSDPIAGEACLPMETNETLPDRRRPPLPCQRGCLCNLRVNRVCVLEPPLGWYELSSSIDRLLLTTALRKEKVRLFLDGWWMVEGCSRGRENQRSEYFPSSWDRKFVLIEGTCLSKIRDCFLKLPKAALR